MQIIVSLIVAVILSFILVLVFRRRLSWTATFWFLVNTFLASWAGQDVNFREIQDMKRRCDFD